MNTCQTPQDVIDRIKQQNIHTVDFRYIDYPGVWQSVSIPSSQIDASIFSEGVGFDGSCVRSWAEVNEGDMLFLPIAETAHIDPFTIRPTLGMICDIKDPVTKKKYSRDPRSVARKAADVLKKSGVADTAYFSPEVEFFVFDRVRFKQSMHEAFFHIDSAEGDWNRPTDSPFNDGYAVSPQTGQFPSPPTDKLYDLRAEMADEAIKMGIPIGQYHHEVATGGQCEVDLLHEPLVQAADQLALFKYIARNVAARHGKTATFMPKPLFGDNGSGMHTHFSMFQDGQNIFSGKRYAGLSQIGLFAIGGILKHGEALSAFLAPTINSYRRLAPGYEAPVHLAYASRNRAAAIRVPTYSNNPKTKRLEIRIPDPACNPYLAYAAITLAALDGIQNEIDPGDPCDRPMDQLDSDIYNAIPRVPMSLHRALDALQEDHAFLTDSGVFSKDLIAFWIKHKFQDEIEAIRARPHPHEFEMYYGV